MRFLTSLFVAVFLLAITTDSMAQRRSRSSTKQRGKEKEETLSLKDKMAYDLYVGTPGFGGGFIISAKFGAGIKPFDEFDAFTAGVGTKFTYAFFNNFGTTNDETIFNYAFFPYARFRLGEEIYLKAEYNFFSRDLGSNINTDERVNFSFPMIGGGYVQGFDRWKFGFEVLLLLNDTEVFAGGTKSDFYTLIEYNLAFLYNL